MFNNTFKYKASLAYLMKGMSVGESYAKVYITSIDRDGFHYGLLTHRLGDCMALHMLMKYDDRAK